MTTRNKTSNGLPLPLGSEYPNRELMTYISKTLEELFGANFKELNLGSDHSDKSVKGGLDYLKGAIEKVNGRVDDFSTEAQDISVADTADYFKGSNVEDILAEVGKDIKGAIKATERFGEGL